MNTRPSLLATVRDVSTADFQCVTELISGDIIRSPLLPYLEGPRVIRLKAECLQPLGSFKIRAASSALQAVDPHDLRSGVATASAGNFAQGLALAAQRRRIPLVVHIPDTAASVKIEAIKALGATIVMHSFADWWAIMATRNTGADDGTFIHPVCERGVILGNGTIGLELSQDWPDLDTIVIPFGGGGLLTGIALCMQALSHKVRIVACEIETAAPLAAAFAARVPVGVQRQPSFVDGIGSGRVLDEMWPFIKDLVDDVVVVTVDEARSALLDLAFRSHLLAEGAGAVALAAALSPRCGCTHVAAVISGGNIDPTVFGQLLKAS
jgi:threonine dehydratase